MKGGMGEDGAPSPVQTELGVVRSFEFMSSLRRMSVVVKRLRYSAESLAGVSDVVGLDGGADQPARGVGMGVGQSPLSPLSADGVVGAGTGIAGLATSPTGNSREFEVFVKGAPEVMKGICTAESLPADYDELLKNYAHHGYRVIACAWKRLENISWLKVMRMKRDDVERDLDFLGFIVFENKLKPGTAPVIESLNRAKIRQVMCTGDNILTAVSVSRECGLVEPASRIFVPRFEMKGFVHDENAKIVWTDVDADEDSFVAGGLLDPTTLKPLKAIAPVGTASNGLYEALPIDLDYSLAITGEVFQWMMDYADNDTFNRMLVKCQIFARMSPEQKHTLVEQLQYIGYCVGFCGDGANDCGALKAADVGLSLSEAEASVAAPFTSRSTEIDCVPRIIREGRAALVTSFACFKYMAVYSLIQFTSVSLLYSLASNLADLQFLFVDMAIIVPVAIFMSESGTYKGLDAKRPTASLVSKKVLSSMLGQVAIQATFQGLIFFWVRSMPWYEVTRPDVGDKNFRCHENTVVFLLSCFQYVAVAIVFCSGPPYRESLWKNYPFVISVIVLIAFTVYATLMPDPFTVWALDLMAMPFDGRVQVLLIAVADFALTFLGEYLVFPYVSKTIGTFNIWFTTVLNRHERPQNPTPVTWAKRRRWTKKGKLYKVVLDQFFEK
ncbi:hypothetical protein HK101_011775 [Irineochytrium annulatum]|nr:hypothetical protein HK101_011775 [Irineochytrium annulatum]